MSMYNYKTMPKVAGATTVKDVEERVSTNEIDTSGTSGGTTPTNKNVVTESPTEEVEGTTVADTKTVTPNTQLYADEASEVASGIYDPLITAAEGEKGAIDVAASAEIEGIKEAIPYVTRQFEAYQAKAGFGTGMQGRMSNELVMDIAETVGNVYQQAELDKYGIDSKIAGYQSAMAQGQYDIATQMYNESVSQATFMADYLGMDYIPPEIQYSYDQMSVAQKVISDETSSPEQKAQAQATLTQLETGLKEMGFTGNIGEGMQTYQQQKDALSEFYNEVLEMQETSTFEVQFASQIETSMAWQEIMAGTDPATVFNKYPGADVDQVLTYLENAGDTGMTTIEQLTTE